MRMSQLNNGHSSSQFIVRSEIYGKCVADHSPSICWQKAIVSGVELRMRLFSEKRKGSEEIEKGDLLR